MKIKKTIFPSESLINKTSIKVAETIFRLNQKSITMGSLVRYSYYPTKLAQQDPHLEFTIDEMGIFEELVKNNLYDGYDIGLSSQVKFGSTLGHILMMDLECEPTPENLAKVKKRLSLLFPEEKDIIWVVIDSGHSFQAYSLNKFLYGGMDNKITKLELFDPTNNSLNSFVSPSFFQEGEDKNSKLLIRYAERCHSVMDHDEEGKRDKLLDGWWFTHGASRGEMCLRLTQNRPDKLKIPEVVSIINLRSLLQDSPL
ncbi:MAG TPA: hypothetical protein VMY36_04590 [Patescibacteria group bacterium]|nr:hypothetical protein [Patescibacteria group bacterium]